MRSDGHPPAEPEAGPPAGEPGTPAGTTRFAEPRRLHPASILLGIPVGQLFQILVVPAFAGLASGGGRFTLWLLAIVGVAGLCARLMDFALRRFSFDGAVLRVDHGVLSRNHRSLDVARIQQAEIHRGAVQRLFGLAAIRVETAGSASEPEVDLRVLTEQDAVALRDAVMRGKVHARGEAPAASASAAAAPELVIAVPLRQVVLASVTGAQLLVLPALIAGALQVLGQQVGNLVDDVVELLIEQGWRAPATDLLQAPGWSLVATLTIGIVALTLLAAVAVGLVRDGRFRIVRVGEDLRVSRGLLATNDAIVPVRRIQLVEVRRNWLRRLLGHATVRIRSAGGSAGGDGRVTVPLVPAAEVDHLLAALLPDLPGAPLLTRHPPAARRRATVRWLRRALLVVGVAWLGPHLPAVGGLVDVAWIRWGALAALPAALVLATVEFRQLGHALTPQVVAARRGALSTTTSIAPVVKVQAVTSRCSPFQRRLGLATLHAHIAGPAAVVEVLDAGDERVRQLQRRLTAHAASPVALVPTAPASPGGRDADPADR